MKIIFRILVSLLVIYMAPLHADEYSDATANFHQAPTTQPFFQKAYGYAIFPTVGKGGIVVGGAYGEGRVYLGG